jgi:acetylornithine deacetylase
MITTLDGALAERLRHRHHPLTGPALLTATMISGGIAPNVVPDECTVCFDRRLAPDEDPEAALAEIDDVLARLRENGERLQLDEPIVALRGVETAEDHPFVRGAESAVTAVLGRAVTSGGVTYSTDACHLSAPGGAPCVVYGPGSIDQAHTDDEWIDLDEVVAAVDVYAEIVKRAGAPSLGL